MFTNLLLSLIRSKSFDSSEREYYTNLQSSEETVMVDDTVVNRQVLVPYTPIDRSLSASAYSLANSIAREVNLDPTAPYFSQSPEELSDALDSYPTEDSSNSQN